MLTCDSGNGEMPDQVGQDEEMFPKVPRIKVEFQRVPVLPGIIGPEIDIGTNDHRPIEIESNNATTVRVPLLWI